MFEAINRAEPIVEFKSVHIGKAVVKNEKVRRLRSDCFECVASSDMMDRAMGRLLVNYLDKEITDIHIIFDYENQLCRREIHLLQFLSSHVS